MLGIEDYDTFVRDLAAGEFHPDNVTRVTVVGLLYTATVNGESLDRVKRAVFYGEGEPFPRGWEPDFTDREWDLFHAIIGMVTEGAELAEIALKMAQGEAPNETNVLEELGDMRFYMELAAQQIGATEEGVRRANMAKLNERYENGVFTEQQALNRDKENEIKALTNAKQ